MRKHLQPFLCIAGRAIFLWAICLQPCLPQALDARSTPALTLTQVIETARANYPAIRAAQAQQKAAQGAIGVARTAYLPRTDLLWQTNRATANNIYGLLLPQGVIPSISGPVIASDNGRSAWSSGGGALLSWQPPSPHSK
jgi:outer membrane protein TolC